MHEHFIYGVIGLLVILLDLPTLHTQGEDTPRFVKKYSYVLPCEEFYFPVTWGKGPHVDMRACMSLFWKLSQQISFYKHNIKINLA